MRQSCENDEKILKMKYAGCKSWMTNVISKSKLYSIGVLHIVTYLATCKTCLYYATEWCAKYYTQLKGKTQHWYLSLTQQNRMHYLKAFIIILQHVSFASYSFP